MQHTLLPIHERKILRREYRIRALIVFCFMLSSVGLLGIAALFPAFVRASLERRNNESAAALLKKEKTDTDLNSIQEVVTRSQKILDTLDLKSHDPALSGIILTIVGMKNTIRLTSLSVSQTSPTSLAISIQGRAATRDDLLAFKNRLEKAVPGNKVILPVSELAKSADVQFALQLLEPLP